MNAGAKVGHQQETGDNLGVAEIYGYDESGYAYFLLFISKRTCSPRLTSPFKISDSSSGGTRSRHEIDSGSANALGEKKNSAAIMPVVRRGKILLMALSPYWLRCNIKTTMRTYVHCDTF